MKQSHVVCTLLLKPVEPEDLLVLCVYMCKPLRLAENAPLTAEKVQLGPRYPLGTKPML